MENLQIFTSICFLYPTSFKSGFPHSLHLALHHISEVFTSQCKPMLYYIVGLTAVDNVKPIPFRLIIDLCFDDLFFKFDQKKVISKETDEKKMLYILSLQIYDDHSQKLKTLLLKIQGNIVTEENFRKFTNTNNCFEQAIYEKTHHTDNVND